MVPRPLAAARAMRSCTCADVIQPCCLHSRPQSSSLLRMTDGEKSSGELWTKLFRYLLLVESKKARLIGQSVTR